MLATQTSSAADTGGRWCEKGSSIDREDVPALLFINFIDTPAIQSHTGVTYELLSAQLAIRLGTRQTTEGNLKAIQR